MWDGQACAAGRSGRVRCVDGRLEDVQSCGLRCGSQAHLQEWAASCPSGLTGTRKGRCVNGQVTYFDTACASGCSNGRPHGASWDGDPCSFGLWSPSGNMRYKCNNGAVENATDTCYSYYMNANSQRESWCSEDERISDPGECLTAFRLLNTHDAAIKLKDFQVVHLNNLPKGCFQGIAQEEYNLKKNVLWFNQAGLTQDIEDTKTSSVCKRPAGGGQRKMTASRIIFRATTQLGRLPGGPHGIDCDWPICYVSFWVEGKVVAIDMRNGSITTVWNRANSGYSGVIISCLSQDKRQIGVTISGCGLVVNITTGVATRVVGTCGSPGFNGYSGLATSMRISGSTKTCTFDSDGNFYMIDYGNTRIVKVDRLTSQMTTVFGIRGNKVDTGDCKPENCRSASNGGASGHAQYMRYMGGYIYFTTQLNNARKLDVRTGLVYHMGSIPAEKGQVFSAALDHVTKDVYFIPRETSLKHMYRYTQRSKRLTQIEHALSFTAGAQYGAAVVPEENLIITTTWNVKGALKYYGYLRTPIISCRPGYYTPQNDIASCSPCPIGTYVDDSRWQTLPAPHDPVYQYALSAAQAVQCNRCPDQYMTTAAVGSVNIFDCKCESSMMRHPTNRNDLSCYCPAGKVYRQSNNNITDGSCVKCNHTEFKSNFATPGSVNDICQLCDSYLVGSTADEGAVAKTDCRCPYGKFPMKVLTARRNSTAVAYCSNCTSNAVSSYWLYPKVCPIEVMVTKAGYWRHSQESTKIIQCRNVKSEKGKKVGKKTQGCKGGPAFENSDTQCAPHHGGVLCETCAKGYGLSSSYGCVSCGDTGINAAYIGVFFMIVVIILAIIWVCGGQELYIDYLEETDRQGEEAERARTRRRTKSKQKQKEKMNLGQKIKGLMDSKDKAEETAEVSSGIKGQRNIEEGTSEQNDDDETGSDFETSRASDTLRSSGSNAIRNMQQLLDNSAVGRLYEISWRKIKITMSFYQMATIIPVYYQVNFSPDFINLMADFSFFNFDMKKIVPLNCFGTYDYYDLYVFKTFFPICVFVLFLIARIIKPEKHNMLFSALFWFLFSIFPSISAQSGETFRCKQVMDRRQILQTPKLDPSCVDKPGDSCDRVGLQYLLADLRINCNSERHKSFEKWDNISFLLPLAIILLWVFCMYREWEELALPRPLDEVLPPDCAYMSVLVEDYQPKYFYYEILECIRKWLLVAGISSDYPSTQILVAVIINLVALAINLWLLPHKYVLDSILSGIAMLILFFIYLMAGYQRFADLLKESGYTCNAADATMCIKDELLGMDNEVLIKITMGLMTSVVFFCVGFGIIEGCYGVEETNECCQSNLRQFSQQLSFLGHGWDGEDSTSSTPLSPPIFTKDYSTPNVHSNPIDLPPKESVFQDKTGADIEMTGKETAKIEMADSFKGIVSADGKAYTENFGGNRLSFKKQGRAPNFGNQL